ncbi:MAG: hypothetical protein ABFS45_12170 [Pseudomonadota bacterium]
MTRKLTPKQQKVVDQLLLDPSLKRCSEATGASYDYVRELHTKTHILDALEKGRKRVAERAEVDAAWVLKQQVRVYERCMQDVPVLDKEGNPTGEFKFDANGANRALELIGRHRSVSAFKPTDDDGRPVDNNWVVTFVHSSKEDYDRREKCLEHKP